MLNSFKFRSMAKPDEIGFIVTRNYDCTLRHGVCRWAQFYQTYGDGIVQHSAEVPFSNELLPDFLASLAYYLASETTENRADALDVLADLWPRQQNAPDKIRFALSLKSREDKTIYFNLDERKTSTSPSKRNDRRWEKIEPWLTERNGSVNSAACVLCLHCYDRLHAIQTWREIVDVFREDNNGACDVDIWKEFKIGETRDTWEVESAWRAVELFIQSHRLAMDARRMVENNVWQKYTTQSA